MKMGRFFSIKWIVLAIFFISLTNSVIAKRPPDATLRLTSQTLQVSYFDFYENLRRQDVPAFVTVDSVLWGMHALEDQSRTELEVLDMVPRLEEILDGLSEALKSVDAQGGQVRFNDEHAFVLPTPMWDSVARAKRYVEVARMLLKGNMASPLGLQIEMQRLREMKGVAFSTVFDQQLDYSMMEPFGHYTRNLRLRRYFRAKRWLQIMNLRYDQERSAAPGYVLDHPEIDGGWFGDITTQWVEQRKRPETERLEAIYPPQGFGEMRAAALISLILQYRPSTSDPEKTLLDIWTELDKMETTWSGRPVQLTPVDLLKSMEEAFGEERPLRVMLAFLGEDYDVLTWLAWIEQRLKLGVGMEPSGLGRRGFSLFGMRRPVDERMMELLHHTTQWDAKFMGIADKPFTAVEIPELGTVRGAPRGFDLMAFLDSSESRRFLIAGGEKSFIGFAARESLARGLWLESDKRVREIKDGSIDDILLRANKLLADTLRPVGAPEYMHLLTYDTLRLNGALSFWTHCYTERVLSAEHAAPRVKPPAPRIPMTQTPIARGYVEPYKKLYELLEGMAGKMAETLEAGERENSVALRNCRQMETLMESLARIAYLEVAKPYKMTPEDFLLIREWGGRLRAALEVPKDVVFWTSFNLYEPLETVADLGAMGGESFQAAAGPLWTVQTKVELGPSDVLVTGAFQPYYEFKRPSVDCLTDRTWRIELQTGVKDRPLLMRSIIEAEKEADLKAEALQIFKKTGRWPK